MEAIRLIDRAMEQTASKIWRQYPVLTITGPRQSGKTTLARKVFGDAEYVNLEIPDVRAEAMRDARAFMRAHPAPAVFDEIQNVPELVSYIQTEVDDKQRNAMYVLTGSHQPALQAAISQSLAGRTGLLELYPLSIAELQNVGVKASRDRYLLNGFMPRLYQHRIEPSRLYADYFKMYVERDLRQLANVRNLRQFETFVRLLAGRVAQVLNVDSLAGDVGVAASTVREWLSILETSYVIKLLRPYYRNFGKRFVKSSKVYFVETGLASYLLGIKDEAQAAAHPLMGNLFENMVVMEMFKRRRNRGEDANLYFMRTSNGVEVDVVEEAGDKLRLCEIKAGLTFHADMAKNLALIRKALPDDVADAKVIYAGRETFATGDIPVVNFAAEY